MRSGNKNTKFSANSKTRRCVVRLKRMKPQTSKSNKKTAAGSRPAPASLRKAPPGPASSAGANRLSKSLSTSFKAKDRASTPTLSKNTKVVQQLQKAATPVVEELPPTIAAGRSRRIHKPNPKYANEDLVTTPLSLKPTSVSSNLPHKRAVAVDSDSDYEEKTEDSDSSQFERITRSRPTKSAADPIGRKSTVGNVTLNKTSPNAKSAPTQLQQLRRTLNASNVSPLAMGKKRKLEEGSPSSTPTLPTKKPNISTSNATAVVPAKKSNVATPTPVAISKKASAAIPTPVALVKKANAAGSTQVVTAKKLSMSTSTSVTSVKKTNTLVSVQKQLTDNNNALKMRQASSPASNEIKTKSGLLTTRRDVQDKKPSSSSPTPLSLTRSASVANLKSIASNKSPQNPLQRSLVARNSLGKASSASTPSLTKGNAGQSPNATPPSAATSKARNSLSKTALNINEDETPTITIDDFETMPTFTIVNINDIINKKGDVLISEASEKSKSKSASTAKAETTRNVQKQQPPTASQASKQQSKQPIKKQSPEAAKIQPPSSQPFSTSTPLLKKPVEKLTSNAANKNINRNLTAATKSSPSTLKSTTQTAAATRPTTRSGGGSFSERKPAPRILNSVVSPRTKPIKPVINSLDVSDDDPSGSISLYTDEEEDDEDVLDDSRYTNASMLDTDSDLTGNEGELVESPKKRTQAKRSPASVATGKGKVNAPPKAAKENSAAVNNCLPKKQAKQIQPVARKLSPEKVVVQREGNRIIKKITCFETWYVINIPADAPEEYERNTLDMPMIDLANCAKEIQLPSDIWTTKVTLYEVRKSAKELSNLTLYNGDLSDQKIKESDRAKYQPSCVMFRRTVADRTKLQLPYDRAVIFKNKTFFTNIEGKNVKLVGAPTSIKDASEVECLLNIVDGLTLQSAFVEPASTIL